MAKCDIQCDILQKLQFIDRMSNVWKSSIKMKYCSAPTNIVWFILFTKVCRSNSDAFDMKQPDYKLSKPAIVFKWDIILMVFHTFMLAEHKLKIRLDVLYGEIHSL